MNACPCILQKNGMAKRKNSSLMEMAKSMVNSQNLPHGFYIEAIMWAIYVLNRFSTKALKSITPYEAWHGRKPPVAPLCVFVFLAYTLFP